MEKELVVTVGMVKANVAVTVYESRQHPTSGGIDIPRDGIDRAASTSLSAHGHNSLVTDQYVAGKRFGTGSVDNEPVANQAVCLAHSLCSSVSAVG